MPVVALTVGDRAAERERRARSVDRIAERLLAGLSPLSFQLAESPADRDAVLRMRYEVVVELGWAGPDDYPDGRAADGYDEEARFVVCRAGDELLGSMRIVLPGPGRPLPVEREFGIRVRRAGEVFEAGRLVVLSRYRPGQGHLVLAGLAARGWLEARALGCMAVVSTATSDLIDLYRGLGLEIVVLGPSRPYWREERVPIEITAAEDGSGTGSPADLGARAAG